MLFVTLKYLRQYPTMKEIAFLFGKVNFRLRMRVFSTQVIVR
ncbi:hypothetical protein ACUOCP_57385 [Escherichia sp. R-CC3]